MKQWKWDFILHSIFRILSFYLYLLVCDYKVYSCTIIPVRVVLYLVFTAIVHCCFNFTVTHVRDYFLNCTREILLLESIQKHSILSLMLQFSNIIFPWCTLFHFSKDRSHIHYVAMTFYCILSFSSHTTRWWWKANI